MMHSHGPVAHCVTHVSPRCVSITFACTVPPHAAGPDTSKVSTSRSSTANVSFLMCASMLGVRVRGHPQDAWREGGGQSYSVDGSLSAGQRWAACTARVFRVGSPFKQGLDEMTVKRMDNVGIVVEDLDAAIEFFIELGLELQGRAPIEGEWAGRVTGLSDQRVEIAMIATPDGHSRLELSRFLAPPVIADHRNAPVNALGYLRVMFAVDDIDDTLARLRARGAELVGEVVQYKDVYRLCYIRGPEGLLIGLAQELR